MKRNLTWLLLLLVLGPATRANAATFMVDSLLDDPEQPADRGDGVCATAGGMCTLRAAIEEANALAGSDEIVFESGLEGTIFLTALQGSLPVISESLSIVGPGASVLTIDADGESTGARVFTFDSSGAGEEFYLAELTLTGGLPGADGGALWIASGDTLEIERASIVLNEGDSGGAVYGDGGTIVIKGSVLSENTAGSGSGGAVANGAGGFVALELSSVFLNQAADVGGGLSSPAGGIVTLTDCALGDNVGASNGGAVALVGGTATVTRSLVRDNESGGAGGGISVAGGTDLELARSTVLANRSDGNGGGLFVEDSDVEIVNATFGANRANVGGGGFFFNGMTHAMKIVNVTLFDNRSDAYQNGSGDGGGFRIASGSFRMANTLAIGNLDRSIGTKHHDCSGTVISLGVNLVGDPGGCVGLISDDLTDMEPSEVIDNRLYVYFYGTRPIPPPSGAWGILGVPPPGLPPEPVEGNLAAEQNTYYLSPWLGSAAIRAGNPDECPGSDQRGISRERTCDIGAIETSDIHYYSHCILNPDARGGNGAWLLLLSAVGAVYGGKRPKRRLR